MGGLLYELLHLWMYSSNGRGIPFFDIMSLISFMLAEITFSCLFIMIANGWKISFQDLDIDDNLDIYIPGGILVLVANAVLAAVTYIDVDAYNKYHDYSGIQGWVLILLKLGIFGFYLWTVCFNSNRIPKRSLHFYRVFIIIGGLYMMTVPIAIFTTFLFP